MIAIFPAREVALAVGQFELHWYGLLYVIAFYLAWWLLPRLQHWRQLEVTPEEWLVILAGSVAGVVLGGRLGYVLFYEPSYFLARPQDILAVWQGGMSAHGGLLGVAAALVLAARHLKIDLFKLADVAVVPAALGLALGRVGNWINGELYVSDAAHAAAVGKNILIAATCYLVLKKKAGQPGAGLAVFLMMYGSLRFITEYWRIQLWGIEAGLTRGQWLTLPIAAAGVLLGVWLRHKSKELI